MTSILLKAAAFILVIILGYGLKKGGADTVTKIMLNITLPSAIATGFCGFEKSGTLFTLMLFGFFCNVGIYLVGFVISIRKGRAKRRCIP